MATICHCRPSPPPLLRGVITINSTVGLSALLHDVPAYCLGRALHDIPGLTASGTLEAFWHRQNPVCGDTFDRVRQSLLHLPQLNASFYRHLDISAMAVVQKIHRHHEHAAVAKSDKPHRLSSCELGAIGTLGAFGMMMEEVLTPMTLR